MILSACPILGGLLVFVSIFSFKQVEKQARDYQDSCVLTLKEAVVFQTEQKNQLLQIWDDTEEPKELVYILFDEKEQQILTNEEYNRSTDTTAIAIGGNTGILFPGEYPLMMEDEYGCLLSEGAAWNLFGSNKVVGKEITYQNEIYQIKGIIKDKFPLFVYEAKINQELNQVLAKSPIGMRKEKMAEILQNKYQLSGRPTNMYWTKLPEWGYKFEDFKEDFRYLIGKENNIVELKYMEYLHVVITCVIKILLGICLLLVSILSHAFDYLNTYRYNKINGNDKISH